MSYCQRAKKNGFKTKLDCDIAIASVQMKHARRRNQRFSEEPKRSYKCEFCGQWHMTSQDKGRSLRME